MTPAEKIALGTCLSVAAWLCGFAAARGHWVPCVPYGLYLLFCVYGAYRASQEVKEEP